MCNNLSGYVSSKNKSLFRNSGNSINTGVESLPSKMYNHFYLVDKTYTFTQLNANDFHMCDSFSRGTPILPHPMCSHTRFRSIDYTTQNL